MILTAALNNSLQAGEAAEEVTLTAGTISQIVSGVWNKQNSSHLIDGTTGKNLSDVRKLASNRVSISPDNAVTTIFDDDGVTPLLIFDHVDERNRDPR
jgi:hypothetical protein